MKLPLNVRWRDILLLGVSTVVVAALAVVVSAVMGSAYSSTALVNGGPGSDPSKPLDVSTDSLNRYLDTELVYIGTLQTTIADNITLDTGVSDPPKVTAAQKGNTNIISMTLVGPSPELAAEMARSAADTYVASWKARNGVGVDAKLAATQKALADAQKELATLEASGGCTGASAARCIELKDLEIAYVNALETSDRYVEVPTAENATKTSSTMATALLGAIVGFAIGVLIIYLRRRTGSDPQPTTSEPGQV